MNLYKKFKPELKLLAKGQSRLALAVSGGSDSMAMALLVAQYAKEYGVEVIAITVDHKLRAESASEAKLVGEWLKKRDIEHHILCWQADKKSSNIQAQARKARYKMMADFCVHKDIKLLIVAHTSEDQAETVLMRMMRGSGVDGLAGMADTSEVFGIKVIRPLLKFNRDELQKYLQDSKQEWIDDPSNENSKFKRVEIRKFIKSSDEPVLLVQRLVQTANHMARAKDYIETVMRERLAGVVTFHEAGFYTIDVVQFKKLHQEERLRSLASALQHVGGQDYRPRFEKLNNLHDNILNGNIVSGCTLWGCEIAYSKKKNAEHIIYIYREISLVADDVKVSSNEKIIWDERFICDVGNVKIANLRVGALGAIGYKDISNDIKNNLNAKILPKKIIYTLPAFKALEKVLAVPHIGYYSSDNLKKVFCSKVKIPSGLFII